VSDKVSKRFDRTQTIDKQLVISKSMIPAGSPKAPQKALFLFKNVPKISLFEDL
jgi:hypothetical protein